MLPRTRTTHIVFLIVGLAFIGFGLWFVVSGGSFLMWLWPAAGLFLVVRSALALRKLAAGNDESEPPAGS
ncbi:hypothetical protein [Microbacterium hominis]|uniref:Uncharacterized protein n=1 Tax=Microbacterium hominis TaxID=162426 RepID=A0A7D4U983_9MICO|nr:hypothetical protein [Microbacterium hominis]QKJ20526.1 hypothetical protein HQM25_14970 [Microbacterium hominis]